MRASIKILGASFIAEYDYRVTAEATPHTVLDLYPRPIGGRPLEFEVELTLLRFAGGQLTPWLKVSKWLRPLIESEIADSQFDLIEADYAEKHP